MKLNARQYEVLTLVDEHSEWHGTDRPGAELTGYFVPRKRAYSKLLKKEILLSGGGDANTFNFFIRNGLVTSIPTLNPYACYITEKGMQSLEQYREANVYVNGHFPV
jgi:hypothetical protein